MTNAALASGDKGVINDLKDQFDEFNNLGCNIDQFGRPDGDQLRSAKGEVRDVAIEVDSSILSLAGLSLVADDSSTVVANTTEEVAVERGDRRLDLQCPDFY